MVESDVARYVALEKAEAARDAKRTIVQRVLAILRADSVNPTYRQAYERAIKKISNLVNED